MRARWCFKRWRVCWAWAVVTLFGLVPFGAHSAPCTQEDFEIRVSSASECLLMRRYGSRTPDALVVWLHGNISTGGPANSHFRIAEKLAADLAVENVLAVALVRPGYPDGTGASSSGYDNGRADNWTKTTIAETGVAIERLRQHFQPRVVVVVGHSGGAAIAAVLMGLRPKLAHAALLVACPCDMITWRAGRGGLPWSSEDPIRWLAAIDSSARVVAITGGKDDTTHPDLGRAYIVRLAARSVAADFHIVPDVGHIDILRTSELADVTADLVRQSLRDLDHVSATVR